MQEKISRFEFFKEKFNYWKENPAEKYDKMQKNSLFDMPDIFKDDLETFNIDILEHSDEISADAAPPVISEDKPVSADKIQTSQTASFFDEETKRKLDSKLGEGFTLELEKTAQNINCNPDDLLAILCVESRLETNAENKGHYGLLQISGKRLKSYGISGAAFKGMTGTEQLKYVEKYFKDKDINPKGRKLSLGDLYSKVFLPGRSKKDTLCSKGEKYYKQNEGLDVNKDGKITKTDLEKAARIKMRNILDSL